MTTTIIAEAGVNHNGSLELAKRLVDAAAEAGADAVKFQTFKADQLVTREAAKAAYQTRTTGEAGSQLEMLKALELDEAAHEVLVAHCRTVGIQFLSSPFDLESLGFLTDRLQLPRLKLASGEITNAPLLLAAARSGRPVILSTGMSTLSDVETALGILAFGYTHDGPPASMAATQEAFASSEGRSALEDKVVLLHCTSEYPAPFSEVNLRAMETLAAAFGLPVGYSDHTPGIAIPIAAAARGAVVVEKHFTIDRSLPGPDHPASLEPAELTAMVRAIRQVEEALGSPTKGPTPAELRNRDVARKSLVTSRAIRRGELFTPENLTIKRPGTGLSATLYWDWLGRAATRDYPPDALVEP